MDNNAVEFRTLGLETHERQDGDQNCFDSGVCWSPVIAAPLSTESSTPEVASRIRPALPREHWKIKAVGLQSAVEISPG